MNYRIVENKNYLLDEGTAGNVGSFIQNLRKKNGVEVSDTVDVEIQCSSASNQIVLQVLKSDGRRGVIVEKEKCSLADFVLKTNETKDYVSTTSLFVVLSDSLEFLMNRINVRSVRVVNEDEKVSVYLGEVDESGKPFTKGILGRGVGGRFMR